MKEAQRSIGVFYRYYKSKDELLLELTEEFRQKLLREIHLPLQPKQDPIENFEEKLGVFWQLYMEDWPIVNSALQMSMVDEAFAKRWHDLRQQGIGAIAHIIGKARKLGYCSTIDPHYAASALCSMLEVPCYNWTSRWGDFAGAKMAKRRHTDIEADRGAPLHGARHNADTVISVAAGEPCILEPTTAQGLRSIIRAMCLRRHAARPSTARRPASLGFAWSASRARPGVWPVNSTMTPVRPVRPPCRMCQPSRRSRLDRPLRSGSASRAGPGAAIARPRRARSRTRRRTGISGDVARLGTPSTALRGDGAHDRPSLCRADRPGIRGARATSRRRRVVLQRKWLIGLDVAGRRAHANPPDPALPTTMAPRRGRTIRVSFIYLS